jgi:hypothetical protein
MCYFYLTLVYIKSIPKHIGCGTHSCETHIYGAYIHRFHIYVSWCRVNIHQCNVKKKSLPNGIYRHSTRDERAILNMNRINSMSHCILIHMWTLLPIERYDTLIECNLAFIIKTRVKSIFSTCDKILAVNLVLLVEMFSVREHDPLHFKWRGFSPFTYKGGA